MKRFMITLLCLLAALAPPIAACAQQLQTLVDGKVNAQMVLQSLGIDVKITGNYATTTWTIGLTNNSSQALNGVLKFPLPAGAKTIRLASDIDKKIRDAIPVSNPLNEAPIRQYSSAGSGTIASPDDKSTALINLKTMPPRTTRTIIVAYQELMATRGTKLSYALQIPMGATIPSVSISVSSVGNEKPENSKGSLASLEFIKEGNAWKARRDWENFLTDKALLLQIPQSKEPEVLMQKKDSVYYCLIKTPPRFGVRERTLPKDITILWDASLSGLQRDHDAELVLLEAYLSKIANLRVNLVVFSNTVQPIQYFSISSGDWHLLREALERVEYDGATQPGLLNLRKLPGSEFLLFSDGIATFGKSDIVTRWSPVYCINAARTADYLGLQHVSGKTGGKVIDLWNTPAYLALEQLTTQNLQLIHVRPDVDMDEVYPNIPVPSEKGVSVSALAHQKEGELKLEYGYGNIVIADYTVAYNANIHVVDSIDLSKLWATQKMETLDRSFATNQPAIEELGRSYNLLSRKTMLQIPETPAEYLLYGIQPPEDLKTAYYEKQAEFQTASDSGRARSQRAVNTSAAALVAWWKGPSTADTNAPQANLIANAPVNAQRQTPQAETILQAPERTTISIASANSSVTAGIVAFADIQRTNDITGTHSRFIDEAPPLFGIGEGRRDKNRLADAQKEMAELAMFAAKPDSIIFDSLFKYPEEYRYALYQELRKARLKSPDFYYTVAKHFLSRGKKEQGIRILSNLAELKMSDYEVSKLLAYTLRELGEHESSVSVYREAAMLRPGDVQSRRELALAVADAGQYADAVDSLYAILTAVSEPGAIAASGLAEVLITDINGIVTQHPDAAAGLPGALVAPITADLRVVINWNSLSSDVDLSITDPNGEKCTVAANCRATERLCSNGSAGFGPEQYLLRSAKAGRYKVEAILRNPEAINPAKLTTVLAEVYTNWGKPAQQRRIVLLQLNPEAHVGKLIGEFGFGARS